MNIIFSWDDGALEDIKLFDLHEKYKIPAIFFVPNFNVEGRKVIDCQMIRNAESKYISFGGHTKSHRFLTEILETEIEREVIENKIYLEDILGHELEHFCLPGGKYNENILNIVNKHYSTIRTADTMNFQKKDELIKPSIHFYPRGYKSIIGNCFRNASYNEMAYAITHPLCSYFEMIRAFVAMESRNKKSRVIIWGHSWEIEKYGLWEELELFYKYLYTNYHENCVEYKYANLD